MGAAVEFIVVIVVVGVAALFVLRRASRSIASAGGAAKQTKCAGCADEGQCGGSPSRTSLPVLPLIVWMMFGVSPPASAADTVETWDAGATLVHPVSAKDEHGTDIGGIALGYNVVISPAIELITQIYGNIPQDGESWAIGIVTGFIATVPPAGG